jgi:hypothetical protein
MGCELIISQVYFEESVLKVSEKQKQKQKQKQKESRKKKNKSDEGDAQKCKA